MNLSRRGVIAGGASALAMGLLARPKLARAAFYSDPAEWKHAGLFIPQEAWESTPLGLNGADYLVSFKRGWTDTSGSGYRVTQIGGSNPVIADYPTNVGIMGCAINDTANSRIVLLGTDSDAANGNHILMTALNSDWSAKPTQPVLTATSSQRFFNTSACRQSDGNYLMAVEDLPSGGGAYTHFYRAPALEGPWSFVATFPWYFACPTIRQLSDGLFYLLGASTPATSPPQYRTMLARSPDLVNWSWATKNAGSTVLAADGPGNEYTNASDMDLCDSAANPGSAVICYMVGDQTNASTTSIKIATVPQTVDSFLRGQF